MGQHQEDGSHGPVFMRIYIELLTHFRKIDKSKLLKSAKADKIQVASINQLNRPKNTVDMGELELILGVRSERDYQKAKELGYNP